MPMKYWRILVTVPGTVYLRPHVSTLRVLAFTIPTTNSFRRGRRGCWTGSDFIWAIDDKNAPIRIVTAQMEVTLDWNIN